MQCLYSSARAMHTVAKFMVLEFLPLVYIV